jgi:hypothetical protein
MSHIFIAHVEEDADIALGIALGLEEAGYHPWSYEIDSIVGTSYIVRTGEAVAQSEAVIVIISPNSLSSTQVTKEVVRAHESGRNFLPILRGISHVEFQQRQPEWREAIGSATSINVLKEGISAIVPMIIDGIKSLGIGANPKVDEKRISLIQGRLNELQILPISVENKANAVKPKEGTKRVKRKRQFIAVFTGLIVVALIIGTFFLFKGKGDQEKDKIVSSTTTISSLTPNVRLTSTESSSSTSTILTSSTNAASTSITNLTTTMPPTQSTTLTTTVQKTTSATTTSSSTQTSATTPLLLGALAKTKIVFSNGGLFTINADGSGLKQIAVGRAYNSAWSPDGKQIAFLSWIRGDIYIVNIDGSNKRRVTTIDSIEKGLSFSPDGAKIAFCSNHEGNYEIYVVNIDGSNLVRITHNDSPNSPGSPAWSPDGKIIAYVFWDNDNFENEIFTVNADGSNNTRLTIGVNPDPDIRWSPDGNRLVFSRLDPKTWYREICVMDSDGSNLRTLNTPADLDYWPSWSPDGTKIVFSTIYGGRDYSDGGKDAIFIMDADGSNRSMLISVLDQNSAPVWSPFLATP